MKSLVSAFLLFSGIAFGQLRTVDPELWIKQMLYNPPEMIMGFEVKHWPNLGDAAAPLISQVIGDTRPDGVVLDRALGVISMAFVRPATLRNVADRQPKATLAFLDRLADSTSDLALKSKIAATRKYVLDQFAKSSAKDSPECLVGNYTAAMATEPSERSAYHIQEVFWLFTENFDGKFDSWYIRSLGDGAASDLNRVVGDCTLSSEEVQRALDLVRASFDRPELIRGALNRKPNLTLVLLNYLDTSTHDSEIKSRIVDTTLFVLAQ